MKTTVEIDDGLLKEAKKRAVDEGITLRALLEDALRSRLARAELGPHPLAGWGGPGRSDRDAVYQSTYDQIIEDIERAYRRFKEKTA